MTQEYFDDYIGNQKHYSSWLDLYGYVNITDLSNLEIVSGWLDLSFTCMTSLGKLERVQGDLSLRGVVLTSLGNLEHVSGQICCTRNSSTHKLLLNSEFKDQIRLV